MVVQSLKNLEKLGNKNVVREKGAKNLLCIFIIGNNAFSDKNVHYAHIKLLECLRKNVREFLKILSGKVWENTAANFPLC